MKKLVFLTTDTPHHVLFYEYLSEADIVIDSVVLETGGIEPDFDIRASYDQLQEEYEISQLGRFGKSSFHDIPRFTVQDICAASSVEHLRSLQADLGVVFGTRKLSSEVIELFADGLINVHRGIAEEYRGVDSELWAIYHNDFGNLGVTIHEVEPSLDTGPAIFQKKLNLRAGMTIAQLRWALTVLAAELIVKTIRNYLEEGAIISRPQKKPGRYYSFMPSCLKERVSEKFQRYCDSLV